MKRPHPVPHASRSRSLTRALPRLGAAVAMLSLGGCGAAAPRTAGLDPARLDPRALYPLHEAYVWSYDVDTGTGVHTFAVSRVVRASEGRFAVTNGGTEIEYEQRPDGLFRPQTGTYLLRAPIEVGASWPAAAGATARVTSVTEVVDGRAGHFEGCVRVVEENDAGSGRSVVTVYCPGQGPTLVESRQSMELSGQVVTVRAELIGLVRGEEDAESPEELDAPR